MEAIEKQKQAIKLIFLLTPIVNSIHFLQLLLGE